MTKGQTFKGRFKQTWSKRALHRGCLQVDSLTRHLQYPTQAFVTFQHPRPVAPSLSVLAGHKGGRPEGWQGQRGAVEAATGLIPKDCLRRNFSVSATKE